jgi:hypothetical protein
LANKSNSNACCPIFAWSAFTSIGVSCRPPSARNAPGGVRDELASPFSGLIRVHVEPLRELGEPGGAFERGQSYFRFERA